jgi:thiol:disulfide interchange protein
MGLDFNGKTLVILAIIGGLLFCWMEYPTTFAKDGNDCDWDAAVQRSQDSGQPTVVLFTANWCPSCQELHAEVLSRDDVREELAQHYNFYTVDLTDPSPRLQAHAKAFGVSAIPTMIRFNAKQLETSRRHGMDPQQMIEWLKDGE